MEDNIVDEVHAIRAKIFEECDNDSEKLAAYYLKLQEESRKSKRLPSKRQQNAPKPMSE